jgi:hypothetical protein
MRDTYARTAAALRDALCHAVEHGCISSPDVLHQGVLSFAILTGDRAGRAHPLPAGPLADYAGMSTSAQSLVEAVRTANPDPHEDVQSLAALQQETTSQVCATPALTAANAGVTAMLWRATVTALADSTTNYALTSYDDAQQLRLTVCEALDAER